MTTYQVLAGMSGAGTASYSLLVTTEPAPVRAAQRLRYQVFVQELGAVLDSAVPGHDVERLDAFCDHLIVFDGNGAAVGTHRLLPPERARAAGALHSDGQFDLTALAPLRSQLVETGRSCVHPDHGTGGVIGLMWTGLARYLLITNKRWLAGRVSVPLVDGGALAAAVWQRVRARHLTPRELRVHPVHLWDHAGAPLMLRPSLPPLLRGYLRLGARACGPRRTTWRSTPPTSSSCSTSTASTTRHWRFFLGDLR